MISWRSWGSETVLFGLFLCTWYRILEVESTHVGPGYEMDLAVDHSVHGFFMDGPLGGSQNRKKSIWGRFPLYSFDDYVYIDGICESAYLREPCHHLEVASSGPVASRRPRNLGLAEMEGRGSGGLVE
jgi:hypothetical protein